jgi:uncharacterized protein YecE (DUF72 family)
MSEIIKVGCCGYGMSQSKYMSTFSLVEVQQTFYQPPQVSTLAKWRLAAPADFEFAIKAWQLISHTAKSPTYRRLKRTLNIREQAQSGDFRLTPIVREAFELTLDCANALQAKRVLFQCPASFTPTEKHVDNMRKFFSTVERPRDIRFYWEPRGDWPSDLIAQLCGELKLFHAVDPFTNTSVTPQETYFRLHGIGGWRHVYTDAELQQLITMLPLTSPAHVFFNNTTMVDDALRFQALLKVAR